MHHRVLKAVFSAAWKEDKIFVGGRAQPLLDSRTVRSAIWWQFAQCAGPHNRQAEGLVQAAQGHITAWEDVLVMGLGLEWRSLRKSCSCFTDWVSYWELFCNTCCLNWNLPLLPESGGITTVGITHTPMRSRHLLEDTPTQTCDPECWNWDGGRQR
eukprot:294163-Karenia_brevis.AAC.1